MMISGGEECQEEEGRGCGRDSQVGVEVGHLQLKEGLFEEVTFGSITQCTEGGSKIKTGKNFPAEGTVGVKPLRWQ